MSNEIIKIMSWNLGSGIYNDKYSKKDKCKPIRKNIDGQLKIIKQNICDVYLFQEVSKFSFHNHFVNQYKLIKDNINKHNSHFVNNRHMLIVEGKATFTKQDSISNDLFIPYKSNTLKRDLFISNKHNIITRIKVSSKELVVFNIHLAPYKIQKELRNNQLRYIIELANKEIDTGNYVIIGGDFNMNIKALKFNNLNVTLADKPTSRDLNEPYTINTKMNYYDGFMYSNNIKLISIDVIYDYMYSDHCPVIAKFEIKEKQYEYSNKYKKEKL